MILRSLLLLATLSLLGCASGPPKEYVVKRDLGGYSYRRYQKVLDVEFVVPDNPAAGHTASYIRRKGERVEVASAFVTVYDHAASLTANVRKRLETLRSYDVEVKEVEGEWVWSLDGGSDHWLLWVSSKYVVKLSAPRGDRVPEEVAETYLDIYPSDLTEHGRADPDAPSAGPAQKGPTSGGEDDELKMPKHLREGSPR
jgi:hypothetical protein